MLKSFVKIVLKLLLTKLLMILWNQLTRDFLMAFSNLRRRRSLLKVMRLMLKKGHLLVVKCERFLLNLFPQILDQNGMNLIKVNK